MRKGKVEEEAGKLSFHCSFTDDDHPVGCYYHQFFFLPFSSCAVYILRDDHASFAVNVPWEVCCGVVELVHSFSGGRGG